MLINMYTSFVTLRSDLGQRRSRLVLLQVFHHLRVQKKEMNGWMLNGISALQAIQCLHVYESLTSVKVYGLVPWYIYIYGAYGPALMIPCNILLYIIVIVECVIRVPVHFSLPSPIVTQ